MNGRGWSEGWSEERTMPRGLVSRARFEGATSGFAGRRAGSAELTRRMPSGDGFRRRPIVAAGFRPRSVSSTRASGTGFKLHFGCAQTRASRRMWCLAARDLAKDRAHPGPPTPCRVASECMDTPEVGLRRRQCVAVDEPVPGRRCKTVPRPVPRSSCGKLLKSIHRCRWWRSLGSPGPRQRAGRLKRQRKKARNLLDSGPLRTECGRRAPRRFLPPESTAAPAHRDEHTLARPCPQSPQTTRRTRPVPARAGGFGACGARSRWDPAVRRVARGSRIHDGGGL